MHYHGSIRDTRVCWVHFHDLCCCATCSINRPIRFQGIFECRSLAKGTSYSYGFFFVWRRSRESTLSYCSCFFRSFMVRKCNIALIRSSLDFSFYVCLLKLCYSLLITHPVLACLFDLWDFFTASMMGHV